MGCTKVSSLDECDEEKKNREEDMDFSARYINYILQRLMANYNPLICE